MSETRIVDDAALKQAVNEILSNVDPEQATFRQIRDKLNNEHNINTDGKKEIILSFIEAFFSGEGEGEEEEKEAEEDEPAEEEGTSSSNGATASKQVPKRNGFAAPVVLSYELAEFMGERIVPRTQVTKRLWEYIKEKNLQNPSNKREIMCDAVLQKILKRKKVMMFQMTKIVSSLMKSAKELQANCLYDDEEDDEEEINVEEVKNKKRKAETDSKSTKKKSKQSDVKVVKSKVYKNVDGESVVSESKKIVVKKNKVEEKASIKSSTNHGLSRGVYVNPQLVELLQLGEEDFKRTAVVSKLWEYIRSHNLQNPADKREILLDDPLKQILGVQKCTMFSINKHLSPHVKTLEK